jgi:hypothetical protein
MVKERPWTDLDAVANRWLLKRIVAKVCCSNRSDDGQVLTMLQSIHPFLKWPERPGLRLASMRSHSICRARGSELEPRHRHEGGEEGVVELKVSFS